ncbi:hypothetical protein [Anaerotignum sp.]
MKRIFALILTGVMVLSMAACGKTEVPEDNTMPDNMANMTAPVDALARCMLENNLTYDPADPDFFWIALYYFTGAYGLDHPLIGQEEGSYQLNIPSSVMEEHASVLFAEYDHLFDLPSIMKGNVSYDPDVDAYFVSRGDIGLSEMKFTDYEKTEDGHKVRAELFSTMAEEEELIQAYEVTLVDNPAAEDIDNLLYFYSVASIVPVAAEDLPNSAATVETAIFNGLADSHTAELTLPDGSVQAFQFDADSDIAKVMGSLKEGDGVTIGYTEKENGSLMIISIE